MRLREYSETVPKPMVNVGYRPDHLAPHEVLRALRAQASSSSASATADDAIKQYFLTTTSRLTNDFVLPTAARASTACRATSRDWKITFVDTGCNSNIGQRLRPSSTPRGRRRVPRQLHRRLCPICRSTRISSSDFRQARQDRQLHHASPAPNLPHRARRNGPDVDDTPAHRRVAGADQRGLLRLQVARSSTTSSRARSWSMEPFHRLIAERQLIAYPARRVLAQHGHLQGQDAVRRDGVRAAGRPGASGRRRTRLYRRRCFASTASYSQLASRSAPTSTRPCDTRRPARLTSTAARPGGSPASSVG